MYGVIHSVMCHDFPKVVDAMCELTTAAASLLVCLLRQQTRRQKTCEQEEVSPLSCATRRTGRHEFGFVGKVIHLTFLEAPYLDLSDSTLLGAENRS